jgi:pimeloyl-ACP methyl ester carboxylesterase
VTSPKLRSILIGSLLLFVVAAIVVWFLGSLLSAPANGAVGSVPRDLHGRDVQFPSDSGSTIHGWLIPGKPGAGAVVLMHGVRSSRADMVGRARFLSAAGYTVLLFDFQAHGESPGRQITFGYLESRDARAAVQFLRANAPGEKLDICFRVFAGLV